MRGVDLDNLPTLGQLITGQNKSMSNEALAADEDIEQAIEQQIIAPYK